jgi:hypothetical protein
MVEHVLGTMPDQGRERPVHEAPRNYLCHIACSRTGVIPDHRHHTEPTVKITSVLMICFPCRKRYDRRQAVILAVKVP